MIIDTSAIVALVFKEPGYEELVDKISDAEYLGIGTPTLAETGIVLSVRLGSGGKTTLARLIQELVILQYPLARQTGGKPLMPMSDSVEAVIQQD